MDKTFLRHAAIYGLGTLLIHAGSLVLLPIYLRCLSPAEYGFLEVVQRLAETVGTCLLFGGFRQALYTFYQQAPTEPDRRRVVMATFVLVLAAGCVGLVSWVLFGRWWRTCFSRGRKGSSGPACSSRSPSSTSCSNR